MSFVCCGFVWVLDCAGALGFGCISALVWVSIWARWVGLVDLLCLTCLLVDCGLMWYKVLDTLSWW